MNKQRAQLLINQKRDEIARLERIKEKLDDHKDRCAIAEGVYLMTVEIRRLENVMYRL